MSRLIVKNLPSYVTPERLRKHFEQKGAPGGVLTDVKVASKRDGTSRRFGFVGFKTEKEALAAQEWFNRTFIDSTRINVEVVEGAKDAPAARPNKRPRLGPSPNDEDPRLGGKKIITASKKSKEPENGKRDAQVDEFLQVMKPRTKKGPSWANEPSAPTTASSGQNSANNADSTVVDEEDTAKQDEGISDLEWMKRRMSKKADDVERVFEQLDEEDDEKLQRDGTPRPQDPIDSTKDTILQTARLFVRNLTFSCTQADLLELFSPYGEISQIHIPVDISTKQPKGVAYVKYVRVASAVAAYEGLDKKSFQGRLLHILGAVDRKGRAEIEEGEGRKKTVKGEKQAKRKAMAGKEFNWSMLYMNSDAVASSIADRMNVDKASILNPEAGDNAAVKLALAETHIIQETKSYLESRGVILSAFSSRARSDTVILVKNIPYGTTANQIEEIFQEHGELTRVLVPPAGTIAVVEFDRPDEAAKAFRAVAYRRLGNSVIYLERGPAGMFVDGDVPQTSAGAPVVSSAIPPVRIAEQEMGDVQQESEEPSITGGSTLFIKNLSFATTPERLTQVFQHLSSFSFARVQTKPDPKRSDGPRLSMGYGFVGFKDVENAKKALKSIQGFVLDGHALHVQFAGRGTEDDVKGKDAVKAKSRTTKMIVKNVPFEATKKDIRELFSAHGHLKSVRLPKKFDSRTRGFAFLEFVSRTEAENAFAALRHTHLLGRHLVLEWAEEEEDLDMLRKKAGVGYGDGRAMPGRKRKLDMGKSGEEDVEDVDA